MILAWQERYILNNGELQAGKHWLFAAGKKASKVLFNVELICD